MLQKPVRDVHIQDLARLWLARARNVFRIALALPQALSVLQSLMSCLPTKNLPVVRQN